MIVRHNRARMKCNWMRVSSKGLPSLIKRRSSVKLIANRQIDSPVLTF